METSENSWWDIIMFIPLFRLRLSCAQIRIIDQILSKDFFKQTYRIEKFFITKFNYRLFVIGMKINMKGANSDEEVRMRFEINRIICNELEKLDNSSKLVKPEITIDIDRF